MTRRDLFGAATREMAEKHWRELPVGELLAEAETAGIRLVVEGDRLHVRGPKQAEVLGRLLLERKAEVLAPLSSQPALPAGASTACSPSPSADVLSWDVERASAVLSEVAAWIDAALLTALVADHPARRNVLNNERQIVRRLARNCDSFLWKWPQALEGLLRQWEEQDAQGDA